jgi:hypothetical protein
MDVSSCKLILLVLTACLLLWLYVHSDTALPISHSFKNVELFMICLCILYNHLTSIKFNSGDQVGRNTSCILGWYLTRVSFTLLDLCIDMLSNIKNIYFPLESYFWSTILSINLKTIFLLFSFCMNESLSCYYCNHKYQIHSKFLLSFEP